MNSGQNSLNIVDLSHYESQIASISTDLKQFMSEHESGEKDDQELLNLDGGLNKILSELVELTNNSEQSHAVNFNFDVLNGFVSSESNQLIENSGLVQQDMVAMAEIQSFDYEMLDSMINQNNDPMLFGNNGGLVAMATANMY